MRRSNFSNTKAKLNIPHEFIHRTVPTNKRITALVLPISPQTLNSKASSESNTSQVSFGRIRIVYLFLFDNHEFRCDKVL